MQPGGTPPTNPTPVENIPIINRPPLQLPPANVPNPVPNSPTPPPFTINVEYINTPGGGVYHIPGNPIVGPWSVGVPVNGWVPVWQPDGQFAGWVRPIPGTSGGTFSFPGQGGAPGELANRPPMRPGSANAVLPGRPNPPGGAAMRPGPVPGAGSQTDTGWGNRPGQPPGAFRPDFTTRPNWPFIPYPTPEGGDAWEVGDTGISVPRPVNIIRPGPVVTIPGYPYYDQPTPYQYQFIRPNVGDRPRPPSAGPKPKPPWWMATSPAWWLMIGVEIIWPDPPIMWEGEFGTPDPYGTGGYYLQAPPIPPPPGGGGGGAGGGGVTP